MKKKKASLLYSLLLAMVVTSGGIFKVPDGINEKELEIHVKFLVHEDRGGRFPGTPGYMAAAEYVRSKLKKYGLEAVCQDETERDSFFQNVP